MRFQSLSSPAKLTENGFATKSMKLNTLKLTHFKNYNELNIDVSSGINCFLGKNGMGKTNLLDALHYLSMTRSALNCVDQQNIEHGQLFFVINSEFSQGKEKQLKVNCYYEQGKKKVIKVNGKEVQKLSEHIGTIPSVLISPDDNGIIKDGSEIRRKLFDSVISQHDREYLDDLMQMRRLLKQRNSLLKKMNGKVFASNKKLIEVYNEQLIPVFQRIAKKRKAFISDFIPYFSKNYAKIFEGEEKPLITYRTESLDEDFKNIYREAFQKDMILQRTTKGAHKDDYTFKLNGQAINKFGSQGQQKSFIIALKLSEYDYLKSIKGFDPMLLLDDIFDKLDDERITRLVNLLTDKKRFSQIFITDARSERSREFFKGKKQVRFFEVEGGKIR